MFSTYKSLKIALCLFFIVAGYAFAYDDGENRDPYITYICDEITGVCVDVRSDGSLDVNIVEPIDPNGNVEVVLQDQDSPKIIACGHAVLE